MEIAEEYSSASTFLARASVNSEINFNIKNIRKIRMRFYLLFKFIHFILSKTSPETYPERVILSDRVRICSQIDNLKSISHYLH